VKGRCPGPLDDRVIRLPDGQYRNCHSFTQGKLLTTFPPASGTDALQWSEFVNQRCCARGCALMRGQNLMRILDKVLSRIAVE
jgi:hypothetical protein